VSSFSFGDVLTQYIQIIFTDLSNLDMMLTIHISTLEHLSLCTGLWGKAHILMHRESWRYWVDARFYLAGLVPSMTLLETPFFITSIALFWWNLIISSTVECTYRHTQKTF